MDFHLEEDGFPVFPIGMAVPEIEPESRYIHGIENYVYLILEREHSEKTKLFAVLKSFVYSLMSNIISYTIYIF